MLVPAIADRKASTYRCRVGCNKPIKVGQVVLHLKLSSGGPGDPLPFSARHQYMHLTCVEETIAKVEQLPRTDDALFMEHTRRKMIETGQFIFDE